MTVYAKIENDTLITAYNGYNGITGLADSPTLCLANGFSAYAEDEINGYFSGTYKIVDGVLTNIVSTSEYIAKQKKQSVQDSLSLRNNVGNWVSDTLLYDDLMLEAGFLVEALDFDISGTSILAILTNGDIYYSSDSVTFSKTNTIINAYKIKYVNSKWYLMTKTGKIYTSTDGTNFTELVTIASNLDVKTNRKTNKVKIFKDANTEYYTNTNITQPTNITA